MNPVHVANKKMVYEMDQRILGSTPETIGAMLAEYYSPNILWHGPQPLNTFKGLDAYIRGFWQPFLRSFPDLQKDNYILMAGDCNSGGKGTPAESLAQWAEWEKELVNLNKEALSNFYGSDKRNNWVHTLGNFVGTFAHDFLDIPATGRPVWIPFDEFHKIEDGKIIETIIVIDLLDLMRQAGIRFFVSTSQEILIPPPSTQDGIMLGATDIAQSQASLKIHEDMIFHGLHNFKEGEGYQQMRLEDYWDPNFMYYAPCSIGPTRGIKGFQEYHQIPWLKSWPDRKGGFHEARFAEGKFSGHTGVVKMTHTGSEWLGIPATGKLISCRAADTYMMKDGKIVENWLHLDIIDMVLQLGIDLFDRMRRKRYIL